MILLFMPNIVTAQTRLRYPNWFIILELNRLNSMYIKPNLKKVNEPGGLIRLT